MQGMTRSSMGRALAAAMCALALVGAPARSALAATFDATLADWARTITERADALETAAAAPIVRVGPGPLLKINARGERVWLLAHRLVELGHLPPNDLTNVFDSRVDLAVRAFQRANELRDDGIVGPGTVAALDRSPRESVGLLRQAAAKMEALRAEGLTDAVFVNLPSQTVTVVRGGEYLWTMRSIVGRPERETPLLWDQITHVIINPTWTVPPTVMKKDKLPSLRRTGKPGISNAAIYLDGELVPEPELVDWSEVSPGRLKIVQAPGDHNALGRFRFNLTNPYSIYLHGTNQPHLFQRDLRTISSGCVRLEDARRLAEMLLAENGVSAERIDGFLASGKPRWVKLDKPLAVRFTYWMATVSPEGGVRLHPDIYDFGDRQPRIASFPRPPAPPVMAPTTIPTTIPVADPPAAAEPAPTATVPAMISPEPTPPDLGAPGGTAPGLPAAPPTVGGGMGGGADGTTSPDDAPPDRAALPTGVKVTAAAAAN